MYKINFIDSFRHISSSLSIHVDNLAKGGQNNKCIVCKSCLKYIKVEDTHLMFNCLKCNKYLIISKHIWILWWGH